MATITNTALPANPLKKVAYWSLGAAVASMLLWQIARHTAPQIPRSYHPVPASYGVPKPLISAVAYEQFPLVLSPVMTARAIAIPYEDLLGAGTIAKKVTIPCFSMVRGARKTETITMTGLHLGGVLHSQITQAKEMGFTSLQLNSRDGQQLIVPFGKDTTKVYLSASSKNLDKKIADTPYDVLVVVNGEARHINAVDSIKFSYESELVFKDKDLGVSYEFHNIEDLLMQYEFIGRDSIPLSDFGENNAYMVVATDAYDNSFSPDLAPHAIIVKDDNLPRGESPYRISAPQLGRSSEVRNIKEIGIANLNKKK